MPPAGYPAFLQYLQSGRVRNFHGPRFVQGANPEGANPGRVDLGGCPPKSPTDPGVHMTRTRFLIS